MKRALKYLICCAGLNMIFYSNLVVPEDIWGVVIGAPNKICHTPYQCPMEDNDCYVLLDTAVLDEDLRYVRHKQKKKRNRNE